MIIPADDKCDKYDHDHDHYYKCYLSELHALFKAHDGILLTNAGRLMIK